MSKANGQLSHNVAIIKSRIREIGEHNGGEIQRIIYNSYTFVLIDIKETDVYTYIQVQMTGLTFTSSVILLCCKER